MELLTKGEVTVTFKSQHGVVSEFEVQEDTFFDEKWPHPYWGDIIDLNKQTSEMLVSGGYSGTFSTGDVFTIANEPGKTYKIIAAGDCDNLTWQIAPVHKSKGWIYQHLYGTYGSRAERRAAKFKRRTNKDGWNSHGKGLERGKQYYKGQKAGHY